MTFPVACPPFPLTPPGQNLGIYLSGAPMVAIHVPLVPAVSGFPRLPCLGYVSQSGVVGAIFLAPFPLSCRCSINSRWPWRKPFLFPNPPPFSGSGPSANVFLLSCDLILFFFLHSLTRKDTFSRDYYLPPPGHMPPSSGLVRFRSTGARAHFFLPSDCGGHLEFRGPNPSGSSQPIVPPSFLTFEPKAPVKFFPVTSMLPFETSSPCTFWCILEVMFASCRLGSLHFFGRRFKPVTCFFHPTL